MSKLSKRLVRQRARGRCEYCRLPESPFGLSHQIDHIRARKHRGPTTIDNICLACVSCNLAKGTNPAGYDPDTGELTGLFDPRRDHWPEHFEYVGEQLVGLTPVGRTTIVVLEINEPRQLALRHLLIKEGVTFAWE